MLLKVSFSQDVHKNECCYGGSACSYTITNTFIVLSIFTKFRITSEGKRY